MEEDVFDKIGKAMPYRRPDNFLDNFGQEIIKKYRLRQRRARVRKYILYSATAAILIIAAIPGTIFLKSGFGEGTAGSAANIISADSLPLKSYGTDESLDDSIKGLSDDELMMLTSLLDSDIYKDQF
jgi:hypothetical protein